MFTIYKREPGKFPQKIITFEKFSHACEELKRWACIEASQDCGGEFIRENHLKIRDAAGQIWTQDEIDAAEEAEFDGFNGGELVFPEYFDRFDIDSVMYYIEEEEE